MRMIKMGLAVAMSAWRENAVQRRRERAVMGKVVARMTQSLVAAALSRWATNTVELRQQYLVISKVLTRMRERLVAVALNTWLCNMEEWRRNRAIIRNVLQRMTERTITSAMSTWCDNTRSRRCHEIFASKWCFFLRCFVLRVLRLSVFNTWIDLVVAKRWRSTFVRRLMQRFSLLSVGPSFACWAELGNKLPVLSLLAPPVPTSPSQSSATRVGQKLQRTRVSGSSTLVGELISCAHPCTSKPDKQNSERCVRYKLMQSFDSFLDQHSHFRTCIPRGNG